MRRILSLPALARVRAESWPAPDPRSPQYQP